MEHGLKLTKIHRVIKFQQSKWLEPYIAKNRKLRSSAQNEMEKDVYKLMNNSIYGKTCENQSKRTEIKLVNNPTDSKKFSEMPQCSDIKIFNKRLVAVNLKKTSVLINKPFYVGFAVLELSKLHMFKFHYDIMKKRYGDKIRLLFTDTDSLMYEIETENIYKDMGEMREHFDLADYPKSNPLHDPTNNKVVGKFKDEVSGNIIVEYVGLRAKMYSFQTLTAKLGGGQELTTKKRAKGIQRAAVANMRHEEYKAQLDHPEENFVKNRRFGSKLHEIYGIEVCTIPPYSLSLYSYFIYLFPIHLVS